MSLIKDLVTVDENAEFRNDVQLSDYDNEKTNLALLRSYLFTGTAPQGQEPSIGILRTIIESFLNPRLDNRLTAIANYGHGKSHLALVLANYFGKANKSPEMKIILGKIDKALDTAAQRIRFHEFRENRNEFLVIRLRGDKPQGLREQFIISLEQALKEHPATNKVELPFWYQKAEQLLIDLDGAKLKEANEFLEQFSMDVPLLIQDVQNRKETVYDICIALFTKLLNVAPNFRGEVGQREILNWVAERYCGEDKPFGGIFVLFDEFSLYIERYGQRSAAGELMDLLNGVEDQKGKAVFVAFAQHDPMVIARNTVKNATSLEGLEKELNRIPRKVLLYSLMESVINAYLSQPDTAWRNFRNNEDARGPLARASNITMDLFSKRYDQTLRWDIEKFDEIVTKGCFPLHPLTTALLCEVRLQGVGSAGNPRTVLGFVFEQVDQKRDEPIIESKKINWVLPVYLVDYFMDYLPDNISILFQNAERNLSPDAPEEHLSLLKGLLLQDLARLQVRHDTQVSYLSEATGLRPGEAETHLRKLTTDRIIRYDQGTKLYSFWPVAAKPHRMQEMIEERMQRLKFTWEHLTKLNKTHLAALSIDIPWGNSDDWAAEQLLLTHEFFTAQKLRELVPQYHLSPTGDLVEGIRGCLIWLVGETEEEVNLLRQTAAKVIDEAFPGDNPPAVMLVLPKRPNSDLVSTFLKNNLVSEFSQADRNEVGIEIYNDESSRINQAFYTALSNLRGDLINFGSITHSSGRYAVPKTYRAHIQQLLEVSPFKALEELYLLAYRFSPPEFFKEFQVLGRGQNNLRAAVKSVANVLLKNSLPSNREAILAMPVARRLCEKFLVSKWQLLTYDFRIREPGNPRILEAWKFIETAIPAGVKERRIKDTLLKLMNPPFGFDYNTVVLLFTAWIGIHNHEIQIGLNNRLVSIDKLAEMLTESKNHRDFVFQISSEHHLAISRRDSGQLEREIQEIIEKSNHSSFTQEEAEDAITKLNEFCAEQPEQMPLFVSAKQTTANLQLALDQAVLYDKQANEILGIVNGEKDILTVISLHKKISGLIRSSLVILKSPQEGEIHSQWLHRISTLVESECEGLEKVHRVIDIGLNQQKLQELKKQLKSINLPNLTNRVDYSIKILAEKEKEFETLAKEIPIQEEIKAMDIKANLDTLYQYRNRLERISGFSASTIELRDSRLNAIEQEIANLEQFIKELTDAINRIDGIKSLNDWLRLFNRSYERYSETVYQEELNKTEKRVLTLQGFFQSLDALSVQPVKTLEEAQNKTKDLDELLRTYQLSEHQVALVETSKKEVEKYVKTQIQFAKDWYQNILKVVKAGTSIPDVYKKIQFPPAFLPNEEGIAIEKLRWEIEQRLEQDIVVLIEHKFREIKDRSKQQSCITRLQKILEES